MYLPYDNIYIIRFIKFNLDHEIVNAEQITVYEALLNSQKTVERL